MEAVIRLRADELQQDLLEKIKLLVGNNRSAEIIIQVKNLPYSSDESEDYLSQLNNSIADKEAGNTTVFSMDEFKQYVNDNFSK